MARKRNQSTSVAANAQILGLMPGNSHKGFCSPLGVWREDDPSLHPRCARTTCGAPIKTGDRYYIIPDTNLVVCIPCTQGDSGGSTT